MTVEERPIERTEVYLADEVFLTGTAAQVTAVTRIDHRAVGSGQLGPVTDALRGCSSGRGARPRAALPRVVPARLSAWRRVSDDGRVQAA